MWLSIPDEVTCCFASGKWVDHPDPNYMGEYNMTTDCPSFVRDYDCKQPNSPNLVPPSLIRSQYRCTLILESCPHSLRAECHGLSAGALIPQQAHTCQHMPFCYWRGRPFRRMRNHSCAQANFSAGRMPAAHHKPIGRGGLHGRPAHHNARGQHHAPAFLLARVPAARPCC